MIELVARYWADAFSTAPDVVTTPGIHVLPAAEKYLPKQRLRGGIFMHVVGRMFVMPGSTLIGVRADALDNVRARAAELKPADCLTEDGRWSIVQDVAIEIDVGTFHGHIETVDGLVSCPSANVRKVEPEARAMQRFKAASGLDWGNIFARPRENSFGYFVDDEIAAASYHCQWQPYAVGIGVVTLPQHRKKGYGRAVTSAAVEDALKKGNMIDYKAGINNLGSIAIARSLGCIEYGREYEIYHHQRHTSAKPCFRSTFPPEYP